MKITIYMKSGNKIVLPFIKKYDFEYEGDEITKLSIARRKLWPGEKLEVKSIALSQIEAITEG